MASVHPKEAVLLIAALALIGCTGVVKWDLESGKACCYSEQPITQPKEEVGGADCGPAGVRESQRDPQLRPGQRPAVSPGDKYPVYHCRKKGV